MEILYLLLAAITASLSVIMIKCGIKKGSLPKGVAILSGIAAAGFWGLGLYTEQTDAFSNLPLDDLLFNILGAVLMGLAMYCFISALKNGTVTSTVNAWLLRLPIYTVVTVFIFGSKQSITLKLIFAAMIAVGAVIVFVNKKNAKGINWLLPALAAPIFAVCSEIISYKYGNAFCSYVHYAVTLSALFIISVIAIIIETVSGNGKRVQSDGLLFLIGASIAAVVSAYLYCEFVKASVLSTVIKCLVVLIDVALASLFLKERFSWKTLCGLLLSTVGILLTLFVLGESNVILL